VYVGCFVDAGDRDMPDQQADDNAMSTIVCAEHCRGRNAKYFGLQNGRSCFCSNSYGRYGQAPPNECSAACWGNKAEMCGGMWRNSVYRMGGGTVVPPSSRVSSSTGYIGCFIDAGDRDMRDQQADDNAMSTVVCAEHCRKRNAKYFGLQNGRSCFCGDSFGRYGQAPPSECSTACWGNKAEMCGGMWRNSVYKTSH
jgi:glucan endo-1,3-alpha-glucosidase